MRSRKYLLVVPLLLSFFLAISAPMVQAKPGELDSVVKHLKTNYRAKKVRIPFLWLARFAVKVVRPAGVKSFNVTLFEGLQFSRDTLDLEMQSVMRNSFGPEWSPIFHIRSRHGQQAYMYMREDGSNVKIALVTVDDKQAAVIRATFSPEKLADFVEDPRIFGISLSDNDRNGNMQLKPQPVVKDQDN